MCKFYLPEKLSKYPNLYDIFLKINKIPVFYTIFALILHNNCPQNFFSRIWGLCAPCSPISYTHVFIGGWTVGAPDGTTAVCTMINRSSGLPRSNTLFALWALFRMTACLLWKMEIHCSIKVVWHSLTNRN